MRAVLSLAALATPTSGHTDVGGRTCRGCGGMVEVHSSERGARWRRLRALVSLSVLFTRTALCALAFIAAHNASRRPDVLMDQAPTPPPSFCKLRVHHRTHPRAHSTATKTAAMANSRWWRRVVRVQRVDPTRRSRPDDRRPHLELGFKFFPRP